MKERAYPNLKKMDLIGLIVPALFIGAWLILPAVCHTPEYLIPSLTRVFESGVDFIFGHIGSSSYSGSFLAHTAASSYRVAGGFLIAAVFGISFGILSGYHPFIRRLVDPFLGAIRMVPGIGWFPLAMVWFGVGSKTTIFLIALVSFFPIYLNTQEAVKGVDSDYIHIARILGADTKTVFTTVIIPASLTGIFAGLRLGMGLSWSFLVLGELTGANQGLGAVMMNARMLGTIDMIIVCMLSIAFWGKLSDALLLLLFRFVYPRGHHETIE